MAKIYDRSLPEKVTPTGPKKETIRFLLDYSKALTINRRRNFTVEVLNN